jgi:hypothetical protein
MSDSIDPKSRRVVLVDDDDAAREGRCNWLRRAGFGEVDQLDFHQALKCDWGDVHTLVVDGFDRESDDKRSEKERDFLPDERSILSSERYMGVRVVRVARNSNSGLVIIVVSGYVDLNPDLVERMHVAGADFIYSHCDAHTSDDFVRVVTDPSEGGISSRSYGLDVIRSDRDIQKVIDLLDGQMGEWEPGVVRAARMYLVEGELEQAVLRKCGVTRRQLEPCVKEISRLLKLDNADGGPRGPRSPRVENVRKVLHKVLGRNHWWYGKDTGGHPR